MSSVSLLHNDNKTSPCPQAGWLPELPQRLPCAVLRLVLWAWSPDLLRSPGPRRLRATIVSKSCRAAFRGCGAEEKCAAAADCSAC